MVRFSYSKEIDEREPWEYYPMEFSVNDAVARHTTFRIVKGFQKKVRFSFKSGNFEFIIVDYRKSHPDGRWINVPSLSQWFEVLPALKREVSPKYHGGLYDSFKYWTWMLFPYFNTEYSQIGPRDYIETLGVHLDFAQALMFASISLIKSGTFRGDIHLDTVNVEDQIYFYSNPKGHGMLYRDLFFYNSYLDFMSNVTQLKYPRIPVDMDDFFPMETGKTDNGIIASIM